MAKLTITTFLTLDGVMQAPGGPHEDTSGGFRHGGWMFPLLDEIGGKYVDDTFSRPTAFLLGRGTYEIFASYWPKMTEPDNLVAQKLNSLPKYVVTSRGGLPAWQGTTAIRFDEIKDLKRTLQGELQVHGSAQLASSLLATDLVDELNFMIAPVLVGRGKRLFHDAVPSGLTLLESRVASTGMILTRYARTGPVRTGTFDPDGLVEAR